MFAFTRLFYLARLHRMAEPYKCHPAITPLKKHELSFSHLSFVVLLFLSYAYLLTYYVVYYERYLLLLTFYLLTYLARILCLPPSSNLRAYQTRSRAKLSDTYQLSHRGINIFRLEFLIKGWDLNAIQLLILSRRLLSTSLPLRQRERSCFHSRTWALNESIQRCLLVSLR
jgi:hypothetical protein